MLCAVGLIMFLYVYRRTTNDNDDDDDDTAAVRFSVYLSVCLLVSQQDDAKPTRPRFTKFGGKAAHGLRKKRLNSDLDPDAGIFK